MNAEVAVIQQLIDLLSKLKPHFNLREVSEYTTISESQIYKLTSSRQIPHYNRGKKTLIFDRKEIDDWLRENPVRTKNDIEREANNRMNN